MSTFKVQLIVHLYNHGGMPFFVQNINETNVEQARRQGQITKEQAAAYQRQIQDASRPVKEQFRFRRETTLPFVPYDDFMIRKGGFDFIANQVIWDEDKEQFELHMHKGVHPQCNQNQNRCDCTEALMADNSGWEMMPPEMPDDD